MSSGKPTGAPFDLTATWYSVDSGGQITYTTVGEMTYRKLFEQAGFDFDAIETLADHKRIMSKVVRQKRQGLLESAKPLRSNRKSG